MLGSEIIKFIFGCFSSFTKLKNLFGYFTPVLIREFDPFPFPSFYAAIFD